MNSPTPPKNPLQAWLLLVLLALIWGSSFILIKKSLVVFSAVEASAGRLFFGFLFFLPVIVRSFRQMPRDRVPYLVVSALSGYVIPAFLFSFAGTRLNSSLSGMLNSLSPLFTLLIGILFFGQPKRSSQFMGILLGLLGSSLLIFSRNTGQINISDPYVFLILTATVLYGININNVVQNLSHLPALNMAAYTFIFIGPLAFVILLGTDFFSKITNPENLQPSFCLFLLGILGSGLASIVFNRVVQLASGLFASSVTYLIPIVALFWGLIDHEQVTLQHYAGMAVILSGVYLVNRR